MARIRTIKPEFWTSEQVMECAPLTRLLFVGIWNFCDDAGRMALSARKIKAQVFPSDDISADCIRRMIDELSTNGLLVCYNVDGKEFLQVTGWHHQKIDRPQKSNIPASIDDNSSNVRRSFDVGREGKGEERKEDAHASSSRETEKFEDDPLKAKCLSLRKRVTSLYLEFGTSPSNPVPETGMCDVWVRQGYDPEIIFAIIEGNVKRGKAGSSLKYHEKQIREAHEKRAPTPPAAPPEIHRDLWEVRVSQYRTQPDRWPNGLGKPPDHPGCKAPPDILAKHGYREAAA